VQRSSRRSSCSSGCKRHWPRVLRSRRRQQKQLGSCGAGCRRWRGSYRHKRLKEICCK
jgi:hypothetical protein